MKKYSILVLILIITLSSFSMVSATKDNNINNSSNTGLDIIPISSITDGDLEYYNYNDLSDEDIVFSNEVLKDTQNPSNKSSGNYRSSDEDEEVYATTSYERLFDNEALANQYLRDVDNGLIAPSSDYNAEIAANLHIR